MGRDAPYPSFAIARKRAVFALRAEFLFLSFSKEKGTKKKGNLRACALKNPPHCTELLRSIKNVMFPVFAITGRASRDEIVRSGKNKKNLQRYNVERTQAFPLRGRWRAKRDG